MKRVLLITALSLVGQFGLATGGNVNEGFEADWKKLRDYIGDNQKDFLRNFLRKDDRRDKILERLLADKSELILRKTNEGKMEIVSKGVDGVDEESFLILRTFSPFQYSNWETDIWGMLAITCNEKVFDHAKKETERTGKKPGGSMKGYYKGMFREGEIKVPFENILNDFEEMVCDEEKGMEEQCEYIKTLRPKFVEAYNEARNRYKASNTTSSNQDQDSAA